MSMNINALLDAIRTISARNDVGALLKQVGETPEIRDGIRALVAFAASLEPGLKFHLEGQRYVASPKNFVAFTPRLARARHVTIELRGGPDEFEGNPVLPIKDARAGCYSKCEFSSSRQLAAAAAYIERAYELYRLGRNRKRNKLD